MLNSGRTILVALLAQSIPLTNAQVGIALLLYNVGSSVLQPIFGLVADRFGPRWLVVGGMGWMILFYALGSVGGDWLALAAITVAGLGSGAFHPTGTMVASRSSIGQRTQATALFFTAGQLGLFLGPILAGLLLEVFGRPGYMALPFAALAAFASGWSWVRHETYIETRLPLPVVSHPTKPLPNTDHGLRITAHEPRSSQTLLPLIILLLATSTIGIATINFAPKLFADLGYEAGYLGWVAGMYMLGSAVGGIVGGHLGDRLGPRWPILIGLVGVILPLYFYIPAPDVWRLPLLLLAGFFGGMPHSVLVIKAQSLIPSRQALASGLALGFMFFAGALGSYLLGFLADRIGLVPALQGLVLLPLIAIPPALLLPERKS